MDVTVLGGTRFIGAAIVEAAVAAGHRVTVVHRGLAEADDLPDVEHVHADREDADAWRDTLRRIPPDHAVVDTLAMQARDGERLRDDLHPDVRLVVLSSMDVYRAFGHVVRDLPPLDRVPLDESAPVRQGDLRYLYRGRELPHRDLEAYEKLDVEPVVTGRGGTVLRLPMVYGERDPQRREWPVLRRILAGRTTIPVGPADWLWTRGYVRDVAAATLRCLEVASTAGRVFNVGERTSWTMLQWFHHIAAAAEAEVTLVRVPDEVLPEDLRLTGVQDQHVLVDSSALRAEVGEFETDPVEALRASVRWHLAHAAPEPDADWSADDAALAAAG